MFVKYMFSWWCTWAYLALAFALAEAAPVFRSSAVLLARSGQDLSTPRNASRLKNQSQLPIGLFREKHRDELGLLPGLGTCGKKIAYPPGAATMDCPMECPFIRPDTANFCSFSCVTKEDCDNRNPLTSFANPLTHVCSPCAVPGCLSCGKTKYQCLKCNDYLILTEDGSCISRYAWVWNVVYYVVGTLLALVLVYVICLWWRADVNKFVLQRAEDFRRDSKLVRNVGTSFRPHRLDTNLCSQNVSGAGIQLHFSWQRYVIIWAIVVMLSMFGLSMIPVYSIHPAVDGDTHPSDGDVFGACAVVGSASFAKEVEFADKLYLYFTLGIYAFSTIGSLVLLVHHRYMVRRAQSADRLRHFALQAWGFPPCVGGQNEEQHYKDFFQSAFPDAKVIGVSIAWDTENSNINIDEQINLEVDALERSRDKRLSISSTESLYCVESAQREERRSTCLDLSNGCHCIDNILTGCECCLSPSEKSLDKPDLVLELFKLRSTGTVYVVFQTRSQRNKAYQQTGILKYGDSVIHLMPAWHDPEMQSWENYTTRSGSEYTFEKLWKCTVCGLGLFVAVTLWALLVYHPISSYLLSWQSAPGIRREHWWDEAVQALLLSLPIMISNQILYQVCDSLSSAIRFHTHGSQSLAYVVMYTVFVTYQTILDVCIVIQTAYGQHTVDTWKLAQASGVLGPKAIAQNPTIRDTLYVQMVAYLYPGTLLLPYLIEPLTIGIGQYFVFKWLIRSRADIGIQKAENLLLPLPFDLTRYGDILISVMCCILVCFIASPEVYTVFLYLVFMLLFCYAWDHWRLLRMAPRCFMDCSKLDTFCIMMLSLPCALLSAVVVFRKYGAHKDPHMTRETVPVWCFFAFFIHLAFHLALFVIILGCMTIDTHANDTKGDDTQGDDKHAPYEKVAAETPYNWFNTNYVHCLRSKYITNKDSPTWCIPVKHGREYLLRRAPNLGLFYEVRDSFQEISMRGDLRFLAGQAASAARDAAHRLRVPDNWVETAEEACVKTESVASMGGATSVETPSVIVQAHRDDKAGRSSLPPPQQEKQ